MASTAATCELKFEVVRCGFGVSNIKTKLEIPIRAITSSIFPVYQKLFTANQNGKLVGCCCKKGENVELIFKEVPTGIYLDTILKMKIGINKKLCKNEIKELSVKLKVMYFCKVDFSSSAEITYCGGKYKWFPSYISDDCKEEEMDVELKIPPKPFSKKNHHMPFSFNSSMISSYGMLEVKAKFSGGLHIMARERVIFLNLPPDYPLRDDQKELANFSIDENPLFYQFPIKLV